MLALKHIMSTWKKNRGTHTKPHIFKSIQHPTKKDKSHPQLCIGSRATLFIIRIYANELLYTNRMSFPYHLEIISLTFGPTLGSSLLSSKPVPRFSGVFQTSSVFNIYSLKMVHSQVKKYQHQCGLNILLLIQKADLFKFQMGKSLFTIERNLQIDLFPFILFYKFQNSMRKL